jgi:nitric oxide reductase activation protein
MFVEDVAYIKAQEMPKRPYVHLIDGIQTSTAVAVVLDQSSSMRRWLGDATKIFITLTEPFDALNCPTLAIGFRDLREVFTADLIAGDDSPYHRLTPVAIDVFKDFGERFQHVKWRFAHTVACHSTPMADGVQYGLNALAVRQEVHRLLFVVTDGRPTGRHANVVRRQIRTSKRRGIHIIGVGFGNRAKSIKHLFDDYVWAAKAEALPRLLIQKLNIIMDPKGRREATHG